MICLHPKNIDEAVRFIDENPSFTLLHGGSDLALRLKHNSVDGLIDISHLDTLSYVEKSENSIEIGALTSINTLLKHPDIQRHAAVLAEAAQSFASHQIRNIASLGGNIVNDSPVADLIAPLLVLNTQVTLKSLQGTRTLPLEDLFTGFKSLDLHNEIITAFTIPLIQHTHYYRKVGPRATLNISKVSLAMVKQDNLFFISGASVNPYVARFRHLETLLTSGHYDDEMIEEALAKDIAPSGSFRSSKAYRSHVLFNMLKEALQSFEP